MALHLSRHGSTFWRIRGPSWYIFRVWWGIPSYQFLRYFSDHNALNKRFKMFVEHSFDNFSSIVTLECNNTCTLLTAYPSLPHPLRATAIAAPTGTNNADLSEFPSSATVVCDGAQPPPRAPPPPPLLDPTRGEEYIIYSLLRSPSC